MAFEWKLREKMAEKGIWRCTDLTKLLNTYGINISVSMVTRIVDKIPERINIKVLDGLCDILECQPSEIMVHVPTNVTINHLVKASGEDYGIKPGPKQKKDISSSSIPANILGPKGGVIK